MMTLKNSFGLAWCKVKVNGDLVLILPKAGETHAKRLNSLYFGRKNAHTSM